MMFVHCLKINFIESLLGCISLKSLEIIATFILSPSLCALLAVKRFIHRALNGSHLLYFLVPDALRTKYEPDVEKEEARFAKNAADLSPEEAQVRVAHF